VDSTFDLLTIALMPGVRARTVRALAERGPLASALRRPDDHGDLLTSEARARLASGDAARMAEAEIRRAQRLGIRIVGRDEPDYPGHLRQIYDPPPVLWVRGALVADEGSRSLAVVGSRACTPAGAALARTLAAGLAASGATIVSGLARGIDAAAHRGALDAGGRTVAVLGSGLDRLYPAEHEGLARALAVRGAVVSEFPLGTSAHPGQFPQRNRLIAGWGCGVVVVEASARSGALITARAALDEGREVFAVPGHPSSEQAAGTNALLRDGARPVRSASDLVQDLGWPEASPATAPEAAAPADPLLAALKADAPASLDDLGRRLGWPTQALLARLSALEVESKIRRLPGALFVRAS
jgi:DNA processing protein